VAAGCPLRITIPHTGLIAGHPLKGVAVQKKKNLDDFKESSNITLL
jgi:hypothetical protein